LTDSFSLFDSIARAFGMHVYFFEVWRPDRTRGRIIGGAQTVSIRLILGFSPPLVEIGWAFWYPFFSMDDRGVVYSALFFL